MACPWVLALLDKLPLDGTIESLKNCYDLMTVINLAFAQTMEMAEQAEAFITITDKYVR